MNKMVYGIATRYWQGWRDCVNSWLGTASENHPYIVAPNMEVLRAFQCIYEGTTEPIIAYIHDDVMITEKGWDERVLAEFDDPTVGVVGFGGALGHGTPNLYEVPYHLPNLARQGFMSNMKDAERHGARFTGARDVAVLDGFALFIRRTVLDRWGGWPRDVPVGYFMYAETLCCEARRQGYHIRLVGVECEHLGGKSSGTPLPYSYEDEHWYFYEHNRDVMPFRVEG
jgi:Glycosyltransferase like family